MSLSFFSRRALALLVVVFAFSGFWACTPVEPVSEITNSLLMNNTTIKTDSIFCAGYSAENPNATSTSNPADFFVDAVNIYFQFNSYNASQLPKTQGGGISKYGLVLTLDAQIKPGTYKFSKTKNQNLDEIWTSSPSLKVSNLFQTFSYATLAGNSDITITISSSSIKVESTSSLVKKYTGRISGTFSGTLGSNPEYKFVQMPISGSFNLPIGN